MSKGMEDFGGTGFGTTAGEIISRAERIPPSKRSLYFKRLILLFVIAPIVATLPGAGIGYLMRGTMGALGLAIGFGFAISSGGLITWLALVDRRYGVAPGCCPTRLRGGWMAAGLGIAGALLGVGFCEDAKDAIVMVGFIGAMAGSGVGIMIDFCIAEAGSGSRPQQQQQPKRRTTKRRTRRYRGSRTGRTTAARRGLPSRRAGR